MIFAVIGSVQGDLAALKSVLDAVESAGILTVLQAGNVAVGGAFPNEVVELLTTRRVTVVQGAQDRALVRFARKGQSRGPGLSPPDAERLADACKAVSSRNLEWLNTLPKKIRLDLEGKSIFLCHGTPSSQAEVIEPGTPHSRLERIRELEPADVLLCGGAPNNFGCLVGETLLCGIGPLRGADGKLRFCQISTEEELPRPEILTVG